MNAEKAHQAANEARRFLKRYEDWQKALEQSRNQRLNCPFNAGSIQAIEAQPLHWENVPKESGALKRASLDLTRALSALRARERA